MPEWKQVVASPNSPIFELAGLLANFLYEIRVAEKLVGQSSVHTSFSSPLRVRTGNYCLGMIQWKFSCIPRRLRNKLLEVKCLDINLQTCYHIQQKSLLLWWYPQHVCKILNRKPRFNAIAIIFPIKSTFLFLAKQTSTFKQLILHLTLLIHLKMKRKKFCYDVIFSARPCHAWVRLHHAWNVWSSALWEVWRCASHLQKANLLLTFSNCCNNFVVVFAKTSRSCHCTVYTVRIKLSYVLWGVNFKCN